MYSNKEFVHQVGNKNRPSFRAVSPIKVAWFVHLLTLNWRKIELILTKCLTKIYN